jgi:hypothetical protein
VFVADRRRELRAGLAAGGAAACLALLAACGGGGSAPRTLPRLSSTPAAVTSTAPLAGKAAELAAVKAVVRRYYALLNAPTTVANADALASLMTRECSCRAAASATRQAAVAGETYFGKNQLRSVVANLDGARQADVLVTYDYSAGGRRGSTGTVMSHSQAHRGATVDIRLTKLGDRWLMATILEIRPGVTQ